MTLLTATAPFLYLSGRVLRASTCRVRFKREREGGRERERERGGREREKERGERERKRGGREREGERERLNGLVDSAQRKAVSATFIQPSAGDRS